jgi:hypothetical protein
MKTWRNAAACLEDNPSCSSRSGTLTPRFSRSKRRERSAHCVRLLKPA